MINIEEKKVPLVQSMTSNYEGWFVGTVSLMLGIVIVYMLGTYIQMCMIKRQRIKELSEFLCMEGYTGWNIFRLRKEIRRLELGIQGL